MSKKLNYARESVSFSSPHGSRNDRRRSDPFARADLTVAARASAELTAGAVLPHPPSAFAVCVLCCSDGVNLENNEQSASSPRASLGMFALEAEPRKYE